jgi:hypothetical protein
MKVPCEHGKYDPHESGYRIPETCPGGEAPTNHQLITELRKRGALVVEESGNTDRLVTRWSHYHQDRT